MFNVTIITNPKFQAGKPNITFEIFIKGQKDSYNCVMPVYANLTDDQKKAYDDFVALVLSQTDDGESSCFSTILNAPSFGGNDISVEMFQNGVDNGSCPCNFDYKKLSAPNKTKVQNFVNLVQQLTAK